MAITSSNDIYLDFTSKDMVTIQCCQYDEKSRTYIIHLMDKGKEITLDNNKHKLVFKQDKKDGTSIFNDCTIKSDGTVQYTLTEQSCIFAGVHDIQFMLYDIESSEIINTIPAKLNVTKSVADNVKIESSDEYNKLNNLLLEAGGHIKNLSNPHKVTKEQVGLGNADDTSDIDKPVSKAQQKAIDDAVKNYLPLSGGEMSDDENTLEIYPNRIIGSSDSFISGFDEIHADLFEGDLNGNSTTAKRLETERTIELTGSVTGNGTFDGSGDLIIETTTNHTHDYLPLTGGEITGDLNVTGEIDTPDIHTNELYLDKAGVGSVFYLDEYGFRPMTNGNGSLGNPNYYWNNVYANTINTNEFTGTPKAPTASAGTNTTQIATTAFVQSAVSNHNTSNTVHSDIRELISTLTTRLNALADSDDTTLDQLSEIVAYIKSNRTLIENVTTNKVNVADIIDNLTSTSANKPLSAKQGKVLNDLIDALSNVVDTKANVNHTHNYLPLNGGGTIRDNDGDHITISPISIIGDTNSYIDGFSDIRASSFKEDGKYLEDKYADKSHTHSKSEITDFPTSLPANGGNSSTVNGHSVNADVPSNAIFTDTVYTLPTATSNVLGGIKTGSNITNNSGTISITANNVVNALGFTPGTSGVTLGNTGNSVTYTAFARTSSTGTLSECTGTFILTDCGNYGGALAGVWLIQISNKGSTPMMSVTTLNPHKAGTVEFGCYESGEYFYFGVCCPTFRATVKLIVLNKVQVETADYGDSFTKPNGWTVVTPRVLQDDSKIKEISDKLDKAIDFDSDGDTIIKSDNYITLECAYNIIFEGAGKVGIFQNNVSPNRSNANMDLGTSTYKWNSVYAKTGTIQTSDRNKKNTIEDLTTEKAEAFIYGLKPSTYKMNEGTSGRTHWGLISQDVEELMSQLGMDNLDFAGFIKSPKKVIRYEDENGNKLKKPIEEIIEDEYDYSLRYDEFIAPLIKVVQEQQREINRLKKEIDEIKKN